MEDLRQEIEAIKERNKRVEADKAWETSTFRKVSIVLVTYCLATLLMWVIGVDEPYISALIPTLGFFLSTLSLGFLKEFWKTRIYDK